MTKCKKIDCVRRDNKILDGCKLGSYQAIICTTKKYCDYEPKTKQKDTISHPSHYTEHPSGVECIQITEHMNFCRGNAIKYLWRSGLKDTSKEIEDLKKAIWYIEREIKLLEGKK